MAPPPHLGTPHLGAPRLAREEPEVWNGVTGEAAEQADPDAPIVLKPARIISINPSAPGPQPTNTPPPPRPIETPPPPRASNAPPAPRPIQTPAPSAAPPEYQAYAVDAHEATLLDHRPDPNVHNPAHYPQRIVEVQSTEMVPVRPVHVASAVAAYESVRPASLALAQHRPRELLDPHLVLLAEPDSQRAASFRLLRDNLLAKKAPRIIAVSSAATHEGKTTCAINLALALSEQPSTRVLLLEGNFFAPSLGRIFHIDATTPPAPQMNVPWLSPYRIAEIMRGFHVAAVVQQKGEPTPPFNSRWFDIVIGHLSGADYDHLIIDGAALDGSPAAVQVISVAEGTLLTARSGGTTARSLRRAAEQIAQGRALGVALIDGK
jgi:Mrp family chromosome partitioning ATPase